MDFTLQDHIPLARARAISFLQDVGANALVATSPKNVQYLTGYRSWTHLLNITNQTCVVLTLEGKRILILPSSDGDFVSMGGFDVDEVRTFGTFYIEAAEPQSSLTEEERHMAIFSAGMVNSLTWAESLRVTLEREGLDTASLAVDQGHMMPRYWNLLEETLPRSELIDAYDLMFKIRAIKTPYEVEMLRKSSECTEKAILASLDVAARGATDYQIYAAFEKSLIESGADHFFSAIGVGTRTCFPNVQPNGTRLESGGLLRFDVGCRYRGFPSDIARCATLGPAPAKLKDYYNAMLNGEEAAIQSMRPGVLACEVFETAMQAARESGVPHYRRHHCGHAIGLDSYEVPILRPDDHTPLEPGMTFCVETPYYELGLGGIQVEDLVLVSDDGVEILTGLSRELFELSS